MYQYLLKILFFYLGLFLFNCMTTAVMNKAYPGPIEITQEQIKSIDVGKDFIIRFKIDTGLRGLKEKCFQFQKGNTHYREEIRVDRLFSCENFQLLHADLQNNEIKNANGLLVLPSHINKIVNLKGIDSYNFLQNYSYSYLPKFSLKSAEFDSSGSSLFLKNENEQFIVIKRYEEWNKKILYRYSTLEKIESPYLKFLQNSFEKNETDYPKKGNRNLPLLQIEKPVLVLFYNLDHPEKESKNLIFEIPNLEDTNVYSLHLDMKSLDEGWNPLYLGLVPFTVVLDIATSPFQAIYFVMYVIAKGNIHH